MALPLEPVKQDSGGPGSRRAPNMKSSSTRDKRVSWAQRRADDLAWSPTCAVEGLTADTQTVIGGHISLRRGTSDEDPSFSS